ncbi:MAG: alpha/beta hydrolase [Paenibacillaceae bacterium]|nr:alpha/beta hydrolase [Paenibacillaceae bacterium]
MNEQPISFYSEGLKLKGTLYYPEDYEEGKRYPAVIPNSGYNGFNGFYPKLFARNFTRYGYICLGFDYRGFAESEGERGRVILDEQVADIRNAVTFMAHHPAVDPRKIGILGWGMGASNVIRAAAIDQRIAAVAGLNGFYRGDRWLRSIHTYTNWHHILKEVEEDRIRRVTTGHSLRVDPFLYYPLDPSTDGHVNVELAHIDGFGEQASMQFTESIIELNAEKSAADISPRPLFVAHGKRNLLHPVEESQALFEAARQPKYYYEIDGEHNDFMYHDHPQFQALIRELVHFFAAGLAV